MAGQLQDRDLLRRIAGSPDSLDKKAFVMANSAQAKKRARQNDKQRAHNALRTQLRTAVKKVQKAVLVGALFVVLTGTFFSLSGIGHDECFLMYRIG